MELGPGAGPPPPMPPGEAYGLTTIIDAVEHIIDDRLIDVIDDFGLDFLRVGDEIHITTSGNELPGLAYGRCTVPANAGFLAFEYQISDLAPDEIVSVSFADKLLFSAYTDTPPGEWQTAVIYVGNLAERTESLIFALNPGDEPAPDDLLRFRNVRLYDNRIFLTPADLNCDGRINAFDIEPFLLALFEPDEYTTRFPDCDINNADINGDGSIDGFDIEPFLNLLFP